MSVSVTGGGSGTGDTSSMAAWCSLATTMFTTPSTANVMYIVDYTWAVKTMATTALDAENATAYKVPLIQYEGKMSGKGRMVIGASTAARIVTQNLCEVASPAVYAYNYVAITVDTN